MLIISTTYLNNWIREESYGWSITNQGIIINPYIRVRVFDKETKKFIKEELVFNPEYVIEKSFKDILKKTNEEWRKELEESNEGERIK